MKIDNVNYEKIKNTLIRGAAFTLSLGLLPFVGGMEAKAESSFPQEVVDLTNDSFYSSEISEDTFYIPCMFMVLFDDGRVVQNDKKIFSREELGHIVSATIIVSDEKDCQYDFLNYMVNLKDLNINDRSKTSKLSLVDGSIFPKGINISIYTYPEICSFNEERYGFLKDISLINTLTVGNHDLSLNIDSNFLQSLRNVENLSLGLNYNSNFKYQDLSYLKSLYIDSEPYDGCIYFSIDDLNELRSRGVEISSIDLDRLERASSVIHQIVEGFPLMSDATDQEKLNAVLTYVLNHFSYDSRIQALNAFGDPFNDKDYSNFYGKGELTGVFENDSQICGNYAAMVTALCREVGLDSYNLISDTHAWNAVLIGNYYYYVDATWLDSGVVFLPDEDGERFESVPAEELFNRGDYDIISQLDWYLEDPIRVVQEEGDSHKLSLLPEGLVILPIPDQVEYLTRDGYPFPKNVEDYRNREYIVCYKNKKYKLSSSKLIGLLAGIGIGLLRKKEEKEEISENKNSRIK